MRRAAGRPARRPRSRARTLVPCADARLAGHRDRPDHLAVGRATSRSSPARCASTTSRSSLDMLLARRRRGGRAALLARRGPGGVRPRRVPRAAALVDRRHGRADRRAEPRDALPRASSCCRSRSTSCARRSCGARRSLESGLKYLIIGSVGLGDAALRAGADLRRDRLDGLLGDRERRSASGVGSDVLLLTGVALVAVGLAFKASVAPFHQWTPDVYEGAPTPVTAFMAVATKAAAFACFLRFFDVALIEPSRLGRPLLAAICRRSRSSSATSARSASPRSSGCSPTRRRAGRLHARRRGRGLAARRPGDGLLPRRLPADEPRRVRGGRARERETALRRRHRRDRGPRRHAPAAGVADDDRDALARRHPGDGGLHRQVLPDRGHRRRRLHVARRRDRDRLDDLARATTCGWSRRCGCAPARRPRCPPAPSATPAMAGGSPEADATAASPRSCWSPWCSRAATIVLRDHPAAAVRRWPRPRAGRWACSRTPARAVGLGAVRLMYVGSPWGTKPSGIGSVHDRALTRCAGSRAAPSWCSRAATSQYVMAVSIRPSSETVKTLQPSTSTVGGRSAGGP